MFPRLLKVCDTYIRRFNLPFLEPSRQWRRLKNSVSLCESNLLDHQTCQQKSRVQDKQPDGVRDAEIQHRASDFAFLDEGKALQNERGKRRESTQESEQ